jgi:signal transduction histidine kinase
MTELTLEPTSLSDKLTLLREQFEEIQQEKRRLEISMEIIIEHADNFEAELFAVQERLYVALHERDQLLHAKRTLLEKERYAKEQLALQLRTMQEQLSGLSKKNNNLEISLETITDHADIVENELLETKALLESKVAARTQELQDKNLALESEIGERLRAELSALQAKETAERASRAKTMFLAKMSHELRTPLNAILGYSQLLIEELIESTHSELTQDVEAIYTAGNHLLELIKDLLDISKIEADCVELHPTEFVLSELIERVVTVITPSLNGNQLRVSYAPELGMMSADVTRLQQILHNLLNNAIKFTHAGEIALTVTRLEKAIEFSVADTGIGIPKESFYSIFDAFTQVDNSFTRRYDGIGIGLTICKQLCQRMGGYIEVDSQIGKGSVFTVRLPS